MPLLVDSKTRQHAAEIIRAEVVKLKITARAADAMTGPTQWLRIRDLERLAQWLDDDVSETPCV